MDSLLESRRFGYAMAWALGIAAALMPLRSADARSPIVAGEFASAIQADEGDIADDGPADEYGSTAPCDACCVPCCRPRPSLLIWGLAGYSYYEAPAEFEGGFTYSAGLILPIADTPWGLWASAGAAEYDSATEFTHSLCTLGLVRRADCWSCDTLDRVSLAVFWDHFHDDHLDDYTMDNVRLDLGYALTCTCTVGLRYGESFASDTVPSFSPQQGFFDAEVEIEPTYGVYVARQLGPSLVSLRLGHRTDFDAFTIGGMANVPLSRHVAAFATIDYDYRDFMCLAIGGSIALGGGHRRPCCRGGSYGSDSHLAALDVPRRAGGGSDTVRGGALILAEAGEATLDNGYGLKAAKGKEPSSPRSNHSYYVQPPSEVWQRSNTTGRSL